MGNNIPEVKLGVIAVSRDCFVISLSERRRAAVKEACGKKGIDLFEAKTTVENETDMLKAVEEVKAAGCNALRLQRAARIPWKLRPGNAGNADCEIFRRPGDVCGGCRRNGKRPD